MKVCGKKDVHVPGCSDCSELEERVEAVEECCNDAHEEIAGKADKGYVDDSIDTVNQTISHVADTLSERISNLIASGSISTVTLWEGSISEIGHRAHLDDDVNNYDYIDIYYTTSPTDGEGNYGYVRIPAEQYANYTITVGGTAQGNDTDLIQTILGVSLVDDYATVESIREWQWDGDYMSSAEIIEPPSETVVIYRIDGIKQIEDGYVRDVTVNGTSVVQNGVAVIKIPELVKTVQGNPIVIDDAFGEVKKLDVELLPIQEGSGTPSPSNVRPITGHDSVTVGMTGKNLWGGLTMAQAFSGKTNVYTLDQNNKFFTYSRSTGVQPQEIFKMAFRADKNYSLLFTYTATGNNASLRVEYTDGTYNTLNIPASSTKNTIVKTLATASKTIENITLAWNTIGVVTVYYEESGLFEGVITAADFAPYKSQSKTVTLPHTVYGAGVGVTSGSGKEKYGTIDLSTIPWRKDVVGDKWAFYSGGNIPNLKLPATNYVAVNALTDRYQTVTAISGASYTTDSVLFCKSNAQFFIVDMRYSEITDFVQALSGVMLVYKLATPTDLSTTPTDITLYNGDNVISSDGNMELSYVQDMAAVIRKIENQL